MFDGVVSNDPAHMGIPGVAVEMSAEEAEAMGAFVEDALSDHEAIDSQNVPPEHDPLAPPEGWSSPHEQQLARLRDQHRVLSELIVDANRGLAKIVAKGGNAETPEAKALQARVRSLQAQRAGIDTQMKAEIQSIQALERRLATLPRDGHHGGLVKVRHPNLDFFLADLFDYAIKDDGASMEAPIFTLSTRPDLSVWEWSSKDGNKSVRVTPSVLGRATIHDKDVLIYCCSQVVAGLERGRVDASSRTVRFRVYDYLVTTNRGVGGDDYRRLQESFDRLAGTRIKTDIRTGGQRVTDNFAILDRVRIVERSEDDTRMIAVDVTLSEWFYNAIHALEVLTIHPDYFRLRKPLARRLYEIARKHCGHQEKWTIGLELLQAKAGSRSTLKEFRRSVRGILSDGGLPEYRLTIDEDDRVTFYNHSPRQLADNS